MHLDLVAHQRFRGEAHRLLDQRNREVGHPDVAGVPASLDVAQGPQRLGERNLRVRPVQEQQINLGQPQPRQAALSGTFQLERRKMRRPDLGGDENALAPDPRRPQTVAHLAFVVVHLRSIDMAVAEPQCLLDDARASASAQFPGAQTYERNARAFHVDDVHHDSVTVGEALHPIGRFSLYGAARILLKPDDFALFLDGI
jgi:hypothetical protein